MFKGALVAIACWIAAVACALSPDGASPVASAPCARLEIAALVDMAAPGARLLYTMNATPVSVAAASLVATSDIAAARPAIAEGHQVLEIDLTDRASERLRGYTASHVGARLAFIVNGRVRNVARILDPLRGQGLIVDPVSTAEAAALGRCL